MLDGEAGLSLMSGTAMSQVRQRRVMKKEGPTVPTVLLKADGTKEELVSRATRHSSLGAPHLTCYPAACVLTYAV